MSKILHKLWENMQICEVLNNSYQSLSNSQHTSKKLEKVKSSCQTDLNWTFKMHLNILVPLQLYKIKLLEVRPTQTMY